MKNWILTLLFFTFACTIYAQEDDKIWQVQPPVPRPQNEIAIVVDVIAEFPGGIPALTKFLSTNIIYPKPAMELQMSGKVIAKFVIDLEGNVTDIKIIKSTFQQKILNEKKSKKKKLVYDDVPATCQECNEEVIRILKVMPKWKPAIKDEKSVKSYFVLPINFQLD